MAQPPIPPAFRLAAATALCGLACACGKPEDASGYKASANAPASADTVEVKTPSPPFPAWSTAMIGKPLKDVSKGAVACKGALDTVTRKHTGPRPGSEIEGWGWDAQDKRPIDHVLLVDGGGKVVGAADVGFPRPDVPPNMPGVTTTKVGWKGVAGVTDDRVQAIGLTTGGATCTLGETIL